MKNFICILIATITSSCFCQDYEPIEIVKKLLAKEKFNDIQKYSKGEFKGHPNGSDLGENLTLNFKVLNQTETKAVVNVTLIDSLGKGLDTYFHFEKDVVWKINAYRALAMTGMLEQAKNELEKITQKEIDSILNKKDTQKKGIFESKEDYKYLLENIKLTLEFDDNIVKHFIKNKDKFEKLKEKILAFKSNLKNKDFVKPHDVNEIFKIDLRDLYLGELIKYKLICQDCFELIIGGMIDNTVGYFYLEDKTKLPELNPSRIIMIREIGNGWYMFKTT
ncbi:MAG: hypothetical protein QM535_22175 [Limnohabitans sp.]|nr:hypothetical protein [Limnohabitans sp.]